MDIPVYHKDCPNGKKVDLDQWPLYQAQGWVDSPDKLVLEASGAPAEQLDTPAPIPDNMMQKLSKRKGKH